MHSFLMSAPGDDETPGDDAGPGALVQIPPGGWFAQTLGTSEP